MRRVVITGIGLISPIGNSLSEVTNALLQSRHGICAMPEWSAVGNLLTRLAAPAQPWSTALMDRKHLRSMGRVAQLAAIATHHAIQDAGLSETVLTSGKTGISYGSTHGSTSELENFCHALFVNHSLRGLAGSAYLKIMSHTTAANLAQAFGVRGRIIPTNSACVSASQGVGYGYENIRHGMQNVMLCGGAEEMHFVHAGIFDILYATSSKYNDTPERTPRPFDRDRDGLVVGEGAGSLILEEYEHAKKRNALMYAEVIGYGTNCDGEHVTFPSVQGMAGAMRLALEDAQLEPQDIEYINAHGTATEVGDIAESLATLEVLGARVPISSTKGLTGHTLGACGAIEAAFCIAMMREGFLPPTRNLEHVDERCAALDFIQHECRQTKPSIVMTNNFAFGGINTSLILKKV